MPLILSIDGNIGSGKSTLYADLQVYYANNPDICFVPEPVDEWSKIVDHQGTPILTNLYKDTPKYAFRFQMMAYISRLHLLRQKVKENKYKIIISERCVQTDKHVFAQMLYDDGMIDHDEFQIYLNWFDAFLDDIKLGGIIYVRAEPSVCDDRVKIRAREGETIALDYLTKCHNYHEQWLNNILVNKMVIDANVDTSTPGNNSVRLDWIKQINDWIFSNHHIGTNTNTSTNTSTSTNTNTSTNTSTQLNNMNDKYTSTTDMDFDIEFDIQSNIDTNEMTETCDSDSTHIGVDNNADGDNTTLYTLKFDGACRGNPSNILGMGAVIYDTSNEIRYTSYRKYDTEDGTNNVAEYLALIDGLRLARQNNIKRLTVQGDSQLIINQINGLYKVNSPRLTQYYNIVKSMSHTFETIEFHHIRREYNKDADKLANKALDNPLNTDSIIYA